MLALATPDELGAYLKRPLPAGDATVDLFLDIASDTVRDYLQQRLDYVSDDVAVLDPAPGRVVFLPETPVTAVSKVETFTSSGWTTADPGSYVVSLAAAMVAAAAGSTVRWPSTPGSWRVTYSHGYNTLPASLKSVVLGVAGRAYTTEVGVDNERVGGYSVKYAVEAAGFSPLELSVLSRYRFARLA